MSGVKSYIINLRTEHWISSATHLLSLPASDLRRLHQINLQGRIYRNFGLYGWHIAIPRKLIYEQRLPYQIQQISCAPSPPSPPAHRYRFIAVSSGSTGPPWPPWPPWPLAPPIPPWPPTPPSPPLPPSPPASRHHRPSGSFRHRILRSRRHRHHRRTATDNQVDNILSLILWWKQVFSYKIRHSLVLPLIAFGSYYCRQNIASPWQHQIPEPGPTVLPERLF